MGANLSVIDRALRAMNLLRPPTPVMNHLLMEMASDDVSFARMAHLIEKDTLLTAAFLQRANSAIFQGGSALRSVRQALTLLGLEDLRRFTLSLSSSWSCPRMRLPQGFSRTRYSRHTSATALLTGLIERESGFRNGGNAHLAALLHDVSRLLVATGLPGEYACITESGRWNEERERECLGVDHGELSAIVLRAWKLAPAVCDAVEGHHGEPSPQCPPGLTAILHAADAFTAPLTDKAELEARDLNEPLLYGLGIDAAIPSLVADFQMQAHLAFSPPKQAVDAEAHLSTA